MLNMNVQRGRGAEIKMEGADGETTLRLRKFTISDEVWLSQYLAGRELFFGSDNEAFRAIAAFFHQLDKESRAAFVKAVGVAPLADTEKSEDYDTLGLEVCDKLDFTELQPIVQAIFITRGQSLPDIEEASAEEAGAKAKKWILIWIPFALSLCLNCILAWMMFYN